MRLLPRFVTALLWCACTSTPPATPGPADAGVPRPDAGPPIEAPHNQWAWVPVEGTRCGSGAQAGLGINLSPDPDELFVYLQGGGACWNQGTCVPSLLGFGPLCDYGNICLLDAPGGQQPTSSYVTHPNPFPADGGGAFPAELAQLSRSRLLDRGDPTNPFHKATYVFIPYCTGDLHAGATERTYRYRHQLFDPDRDFKMHFHGALNFQRYLDRLAATRPAVKRIWLTGVSAGGYGAALNYEAVRRRFPDAEVHLLADSAPLLLPSAHWPQWPQAWGLAFPPECIDCDAGFPQLARHLLGRWKDARFALLATERDRVIRYYFDAPAGLQAFVDPPLNPYASGLAQLERDYQQHPHAGYFVVPGEAHVLLGGCGVALPDGGYSAAQKSPDGGTDLKRWVDGWATGRPEWKSVP